MTTEQWIQQLNHPDKEMRLDAVEELNRQVRAGKLPVVERTEECNNHVHSQYSFSSYSPSMIAWKAYQAGLRTCGIVDHDSVSGCLEFREACKILGVVPTIGFEIRLTWEDTPLKDQVFNNPDQRSVGYFPIHGVPLAALPRIQQFLEPIRREREQRNRRMTEKIDAILSDYQIHLNFDEHVIPISKWMEGGTITERHLLHAAGQQILKKYGRGEPVIRFLEDELHIHLNNSARGYLMETENPCYEYDVTNILKGFFSEKMYVPATKEETPDVRTIIPYLNELGCIPTYTYLGDVRGESVTGDKKPQKFEDDILDDLVYYAHQYGMQGLSYAPSRNSKDQVQRVRDLCSRYQMLEICGEDINQPRQPFVNTTMSAEEKKLFNDTTWAIIGHESIVQQNPGGGILSEEAKKAYPDLADRINVFRKAGMKYYG